MANRKKATPVSKPKRAASKGELTAEERKAKWQFVFAVEALMLEMDAESVGRIADDVGAVVECLQVIVDAMGRRS